MQRGLSVCPYFSFLFVHITVLIGVRYWRCFTNDNLDLAPKKGTQIMLRKHILILTASALFATLPLLSGCGGGSSQTTASQQDSGSLQPFSLGSLIGRAAISNPPISTNSANT